MTHHGTRLQANALTVSDGDHVWLDCSREAPFSCPTKLDLLEPSSSTHRNSPTGLRHTATDLCTDYGAVLSCRTEAARAQRAAVSGVALPEVCWTHSRDWTGPLLLRHSRGVLALVISCRATAGLGKIRARGTNPHVPTFSVGLPVQMQMARQLVQQENLGSGLGCSER